MKMEVKSKLHYKRTFLSLLAIPFFLISCTNNKKTTNKTYYGFNTFINFNCEGDIKEETLTFIENKITRLSNTFDAYKHYEGYKNVYDLNNASDYGNYEDEVKDIITLSNNFHSENDNFNPLIKNLSDLWKNNLNIGKIPSETDINLKLDEINNTVLLTDENKGIKLNGNAKFDFGAIAKGYLVNKIVEKFNEDKLTNYIFNAGQSSIALGEKSSDDGLYKVGIEHYSNCYLKLKNTSLATSSIFQQGVTIGDKTYSHIINPKTGSAINNFDLVIAIGNDAMKCDVASTVGMLSELKDLTNVETQFDVKLVAFKGENISYCNQGITIYHA